MLHMALAKALGNQNLYRLMKQFFFGVAEEFLGLGIGQQDSPASIDK